MAVPAQMHIRQMHMNTGQKASLVLHGGLLLWVVLVDLFHAPSEPMLPDVTEVSIISSQDFAELVAPPESVAQPAPEPAPVASPTPPARPQPQPEPTPAPITPPPPVAPQPTPTPAPAPEPERPQAAVVAPSVTPDASLQAVQRPADRVAPEAAPTPEPEVTIAPRDQAAIVPDATATVTAPEAQEATQREAAATETVTEATRISETEPARRTATAPEVSLLPRRRPAQAAQQPAPTAETAATRPTPPAIETPATPAPAAQAPAASGGGPSASAVEDALAQAMAGAFDQPAALSQADSDMLRLNIEACWNVGLLSTEALNTIVTISFEMTPDARPVESSIRLVGAEGGSFVAQQAAFDAGRQAIVQCGMQGYGLPSDLYDQWRLVEITFNPARMSTR